MLPLLVGAVLTQVPEVGHFTRIQMLVRNVDEARPILLGLFPDAGLAGGKDAGLATFQAFGSANANSLNCAWTKGVTPTIDKDGTEAPSPGLVLYDKTGKGFPKASLALPKNLKEFTAGFILEWLRSYGVLLGGDDEIEEADEAYDLALVEGRALLWDCADGEQMSKQRRGIMWALRLARRLKRTFVLPPLRFHTSSGARHFEYRPYSALFDLAPLQRLHPTVELAPFLELNDRHVDRILSHADNEATAGKRGKFSSDVCPMAPSGAVLGPDACTVGADGSQVCLTPISFGGADGTVKVTNFTCGNAKTDIDWEAELGQEAPSALGSIGLQGLAMQIVPPKEDEDLTTHYQSQNKEDVKATTEKPLPTRCGWRCPYATIRAAMVYQPRFVNLAKGYLVNIKKQHRTEEVDWPKVLGVHWRRGDFLHRAGGPTETLLSARDLAVAIQERLKGWKHGGMVFLATNAEADEIAQLREALDADVPLLQYNVHLGDGVGAPELAVLDTLVCSLADGFLGTRGSLFTRNILEERVLQGKRLKSGGYMV